MQENIEDIDHILSYSGGLGSFYTGLRVKERYGSQYLFKLFTDTLCEDNDTYRFMLEGAAVLEDKPLGAVAHLVKLTKQIPPLEDIDDIKVITDIRTSPKMQARKDALAELKEETEKTLENMFWLSKGITIWETYLNKRVIGNSMIDPCSEILKRNSMIDPCSEILKRNLMKKWIKASPWGTTWVYIGIDWSEVHRYENAIHHYLPYKLLAPLCEAPYVTKKEMMIAALEYGIKPSYSYQQGFSHDNCGGFCCKGGQGHHALFYQQRPARFLWHAKMEQLMREYLEKDVSILTYQKNKEIFTLPLYEIQRRVEAGEYVDKYDIGGCACALPG